MCSEGLLGNLRRLTATEMVVKFYQVGLQEVPAFFLSFWVSALPGKTGWAIA
jgi:hypothetical protein